MKNTITMVGKVLYTNLQTTTDQKKKLMGEVPTPMCAPAISALPPACISASPMPARARAAHLVEVSPRPRVRILLIPAFFLWRFAIFIRAGLGLDFSYQLVEPVVHGPITGRNML